MPGEFPAPQKRNRIGHLPARRSAVHIGREGFREESERCRRIADLEVAEREMPIQVTVQRAVARKGRKPRRQEGPGRVRIALLIAEVRAGVRGPGVFGVLGRLSLSILRERHPVMGRKPPVVAVDGRKVFQQVQQSAFLPCAAGTADQAVGERSGGQHHGIADVVIGFLIISSIFMTSPESSSYFSERLHQLQNRVKAGEGASVSAAAGAAAPGQTSPHTGVQEPQPVRSGCRLRR
jgi:hypothetical protein